MVYSVNSVGLSRRKSKRYAVPLSVSHHGSAHKTLRDWSFSGGFIEGSDAAADLGSVVSYWITREGTEERGCISVRIMRICDDGVAVSFETLSPEAFQVMDRALTAKMAPRY